TNCIGKSPPRSKTSCLHMISTTETTAMASNDKMRPAPDMENVVQLATQMCNTMLVCLREVHHYLIPKAKADGIVLDAQSAQALAMSLWIAVSHEKAWLYMPATRFEPEQKQRAEEKTVPFTGGQAMSKALRNLRLAIARDGVNEEELLAILREATPRDST